MTARHQITLQIKHPFTICLGLANTPLYGFSPEGEFLLVSPCRVQTAHARCLLIPSSLGLQHKVLWYSSLQSKVYRLRDPAWDLKWINTTYLLLQCQSSSGSDGKAPVAQLVRASSKDPGWNPGSILMSFFFRILLYIFFCYDCTCLYTDNPTLSCFYSVELMCMSFLNFYDLEVLCSVIIISNIPRQGEVIICLAKSTPESMLMDTEF